MLSLFEHKLITSGAIALCILLTTSCKKFVEVQAPTSSVNEANVYQSDATAIAVLTGVYGRMSSQSMFSGPNGISLLAGLSADEFTLTNVVSSTQWLAYYRNQLLTNPNENYGTEFWTGSGLFSYIFTCNAAIEGLNNSQSLTASVKNQLLGEAKFLRAYYFFYLANFYGDVVLPLSTNPNVNAKLPRSPKQKVYDQVVADLKDAETLLSSDFLDATLLRSTSERVRPTKWAATALLARTYLYLGQWANAETEASKIIANTGQFSLAPLNAVFLKNNSEAIWQLQPVQPGRNTEDALIFVLPPSGPNANQNPVYLSSQQLNAFESGDARRKAGGWVDSVQIGSTSYYYSAKYKATTISGSSFTEYQMMFRLGEQYLIRAEARAMQNNFQGARDDLNAIRTRAGLQGTTANDQASLLTAILHERQVELFTEMGQRWLDLKRTGKVDEVMNTVTPLKGNAQGWKSYQQLYPIPYTDIQMNPAIVQNSGY